MFFPKWMSYLTCRVWEVIATLVAWYWICLFEDAVLEKIWNLSFVVEDAFCSTYTPWFVYSYVHKGGNRNWLWTIQYVSVIVNMWICVLWIIYTWNAVLSSTLVTKQNSNKHKSFAVFRQASADHQERHSLENIYHVLQKYIFTDFWNPTENVESLGFLWFSTENNIWVFYGF